MSTFNGQMPEFPDIRVDFFRRSAGSRPPLACFLSHVHSDHLAGLETLRSPFVYCSAATKAILLNLERYPSRINFARGILESRTLTYKHLKNVLKPLPLETPTVLELEPGNTIQVILFDANHCPGSVMFLIEGSGNSILYTGDVRAEPWFVNTIARNPSLILYTSGIRTLDKVYLDTTFLDDTPFETKNKGIAELVRKVLAYPSDTVFYFPAWTFGYEDVWLALSKALNSQIHVDSYKSRIYNSLTQWPSQTSPSSTPIHLTPEAPALSGFRCANGLHKGILTSDESARIHSCEEANRCTAAKDPRVVRIVPVVARVSGHGGGEIREMGAGGGGSDLTREVEFDVGDLGEIDALLDWMENQYPEEMTSILRNHLSTSAEQQHLLSLSLEGGKSDIHTVIQALVKSAEVTKTEHLSPQPLLQNIPKVKKSSFGGGTITFPYSRHSSYEEQCHLLDIFRPKDVWPCTAVPQAWSRNGLSISSLFKNHCLNPSNIFAYDVFLAQYIADQEQDESQRSFTSSSQPRTPIRDSSPAVQTPMSLRRHTSQTVSPMTRTNNNFLRQHGKSTTSHISAIAEVPTPKAKDTVAADVEVEVEVKAEEEDSQTFTTPARESAYLAMLTNARTGRCEPIPLLCTSSLHFDEEMEL